jgi:hypothetical protein
VSELRPVPKPERTPKQRGRAAKRKGYRAERKVADALGGERVPLSGSLGGKLSGDVVDKLGNTVEVKQRKSGFGLLYRCLELEAGHGVESVKYSKAVEDGRKQPPAYAVVAQDNSPRLAVMTLATLIELLDRVEAAERRAAGGDLDRAIEILEQARRGA